MSKLEENYSKIDEEQERKNLAENYARIFALEDTFESLYDVELESGHYVSFARDEFYQRNISDKLVSQSEFFEDLKTNIERVIYKDDRAYLFEVLTFSIVF